MKSYKKTVIAILLAVVLCSMACIEVFLTTMDIPAIPILLSMSHDSGGEMRLKT